jgi:molybdate-binding protein
MTQDESLALRALRDCGVVRVTLGKVPHGYQMLQVQGLVTARRVENGQADIGLNGRGVAAASMLKPWREDQ